MSFLLALEEVCSGVFKERTRWWTFGHVSDMLVGLLVTQRQFSMNRTSQSSGSDWFLTGGPELANAAVSARSLQWRVRHSDIGEIRTWIPFNCFVLEEDRCLRILTSLIDIVIYTRVHTLEPPPVNCIPFSYRNQPYSQPIMKILTKEEEQEHYKYVTHLAVAIHVHEHC